MRTFFVIGLPLFFASYFCCCCCMLLLHHSKPNGTYFKAKISSFAIAEKKIECSEQGKKFINLVNLSNSIFKLLSVGFIFISYRMLQISWRFNITWKNTLYCIQYTNILCFIQQILSIAASLFSVLYYLNRNEECSILVFFILSKKLKEEKTKSSPIFRNVRSKEELSFCSCFLW